MIAYPMGREPDYWQPSPEHGSYRFALGNVARVTSASPPLIALGMNPSHARSGESDRTINRLIAASDDNGYSGWIMLNLYPERSSTPSRLTAYDADRSAMNCVAIEEVLRRHRVTEVLGAWGNMPHPTLRRARLDVQALLDRMGVAVFTWDPLTIKGNPRHPSPPGRPLAMLGPKRYLS